MRNSSATTEIMHASPAKINKSLAASPHMRMKANHPVKEQAQEEEYYAMATNDSNRKKRPTASLSKKSVNRRDERGGNSPQKAAESNSRAIADN